MKTLGPSRDRPRPFDSVRSNIISLVCDIAVRTGRKIKWDPKIDAIVGDEEAAKLAHREMREPRTI